MRSDLSDHDPKAELNTHLKAELSDRIQPALEGVGAGIATGEGRAPGGEPSRAPAGEPSKAPGGEQGGVRPGEQREIWVCRLGRISYGTGLEIQRGLAAMRVRGEIPDVVLLLEHDPVYTIGRRASAEELPMGEAFYRGRGIDVVKTDRGGKVTYHGPGQVVGYPIMAVPDVVAHVRAMELAIVLALAEIGVEARGRSGEGPEWTGVWVQERKIASLGVHCAHGVSTHGFAINVVTDMEPFTWVVPCGLAGVRMTSVEQELGRGPDCGVESFGDLIAERLSEVHGAVARQVDRSSLLRDRERPSARAGARARMEARA